jgi:hypothetical protein
VDISSYTPKQTGIMSRPNVSADMIAELAAKLGPSIPEATPPVPTARPAVTDRTSIRGGRGRGDRTPDPRATEVADEVKKMDWKKMGITSLTAGAIVAVLVGGFFGIRRFLRSRDSNEEAQRLLSTPGTRASIIAIRRKHKDLFDAAKTDPEKRKQLEVIIAREINNTRDS